jgi:hypothetical protein
MGLQGFEHAYPKTLSGGMKQRLAIARAYAVNPKLLFMDEPFAALDAQTRELMQELILEILAKEQKTILFVTHSVEEAIFIGNRIVVVTARPARLHEIIDIPFGFPRQAEVRTSAEFTASGGTSSRSCASSTGRRGQRRTTPLARHEEEHHGTHRDHRHRRLHRELGRQAPARGRPRRGRARPGGASPECALLGIQGVPVERLDVADRDAFAGFLREAAPDGIVHLVSLLMPTCRDRPGTCASTSTSRAS